MNRKNRYKKKPNIILYEAIKDDQDNFHILKFDNKNVKKTFFKNKIKIIDFLKKIK